MNHNKTPLGPPRHMPVLTYIQTLIHSTNRLFMFDFPDKNIVFLSVQQTMRYRYCWYLSHTPTSYGWVVMFLLSFVCAKNKNVVRYNIMSPLILQGPCSVLHHLPMVQGSYLAFDSAVKIICLRKVPIQSKSKPAIKRWVNNFNFLSGSFILGSTKSWFNRLFIAAVITADVITM